MINAALCAFILWMLVITSTVVFGVYRELIIFYFSIMIIVVAASLCFTHSRFRFSVSAFFILFCALLSIALSLLGGLVTLAEPTFTVTVFILVSLFVLVFSENIPELAQHFFTDALTVFVLLFGIANVTGLHDLQQDRALGLFDNPNGLGRYAMFACLFNMAMLFAASPNIKSRFKLNAIGFLVNFTFLILSGSVGSILCFLGGAHIFVSFKLLYSKFNGKSGLTFLVGSLLSFLLILVLAFLALYFLDMFGLVGDFFDRVVAKLGPRSPDACARCGEIRYEVWKLAFHNLTIFGGVNNFDFMLIPDVHNNYLSIALNHGVALSVLFHLVIFYMTISSLLYFKTNGESLYLIAGVFGATTMAYWIAETGASIMGVWLTFIFSGFAHMQIERNNEKE